jgi:trimethylamine:corrinoid methyltransferase-like protein
MKDKTTLKRLEERAARRPQNAYAEYERAKLDAMTDEQLEREIAMMERLLAMIKDGSFHNE